MPQSHSPDHVELRALRDFPDIRCGDDIPRIIYACAERNGIEFANNDVLVVAQKIVSKAEGQLRALADVHPSAEALEFADRIGKDPRLIELILQESVCVIRHTDKLIITENRLGIVMANAGIDQSNVEDGFALLLPADPDCSASAIRQHIENHAGCRVGVVIADSIGRAWRNGIIGHAIGISGILAVLDLRGTCDRYGRVLQVTEVAIADEIAAAASMLMGQGSEGRPVVLIRGFEGIAGNSSAGDLLRDRSHDLFR